jgi:ubiquinone/menaquinone biosynthesis C-methylase UbiE
MMLERHSSSTSGDGIICSGDFFVTREDVLEAIEADGKRLLDVGTGELAIIAARDFGCDVTCVDISESAIESAREKAAEMGLADRLHYEHADSADLPFDDGSFDLAVSWNAMHHIPLERREMVLSELCRAAREAVAIADFTPAKFERIHGGSDYAVVDFTRVSGRLGGCGDVIALDGDDEQMGAMVRMNGQAGVHRDEPE